VIATAEQNEIRKPTPTEREMAFDYLKYAPANLKIQTLQGQLVPFQFNEIQILLHEIFADLETLVGYIRAYILKARREGVTTYITGRNYHKTTHNFNHYTYTIAHEPEATEFIFEMVKRYYNNCQWKPETKYNNKKKLHFNNQHGTGLDSAMTVATAAKEDIGSSQLIHDLHMSEMAKYPAELTKDILDSILSCVPKEPGTSVVMESTGKGMGGPFHDGYWAARYRYEIFLQNGTAKFRRTINPDANRHNNYAAIFIPCYVFKKYQMDPASDFKRTTHVHPTFGNEQKLCELYGVNDCFLAWRRDTIVNECKGSLATFKQEYPMNAEEAFISSGRPVFDPVTQVLERKKAIELKRRVAGKDDRTYYSCQMSTGQWIAASSETGTDGLLQVFEEYKPGTAYVVSADVCEGLEEGDFDAAEVMEQLTGKTTAAWHGKLAPGLFGVLLAHIGNRYGQAYIAPERNNHGIAVVEKLVGDRSQGGMDYQNVYAEMVIEPPAKPRKRWGWHTGSSRSSGKFVIIDEMAADFRANPNTIRCTDTLGEMLTYMNNPDGTMGASKGRFDDRVMTRAIGNYVRKRLPLPSAGPADQTAPGASTNTTPAPPIGGWT